MRSRSRSFTAATVTFLALVATACNGYLQPVVVGDVWDRVVDGEPHTEIPLSVLDQPSGLAASRTTPGLLYVHSEKDRRTMVAMTADHALVLGRYDLAFPTIFDWEDIAVGPCPAGSCIYAGDIGTWRGDAKKPDDVMSVLRVPEPRLGDGQTTGTLAGDYLPFVYPGRVRKDAEALMVHPTTGQIFVITKSASGTSEVYRFPTATPTPNVVQTLEKVGTITVPLVDDDPNSRYVTAASIHPTENTFIVRTYRSVFEFRGTPGESFATAIAATPVRVPDTVEPQGEAIEYALDGQSYFTLSEMPTAPYTLKRVDRVPPEE